MLQRNTGQGNGKEPIPLAPLLVAALRLPCGFLRARVFTCGFNGAMWMVGSVLQDGFSRCHGPGEFFGQGHNDVPAAQAKKLRNLVVGITNKVGCWGFYHDKKLRLGRVCYPRGPSGVRLWSNHLVLPGCIRGSAAILPCRFRSIRFAHRHHRRCYPMQSPYVIDRYGTHRTHRSHV
jgi:hypothetical protein